ncbi:MAG TPA: DUF2845 domain-containing protein [Nitrococcus sp.]|nr:DUF2845 domain-containing protein [Nitrococcus sp.]
MLLPSRLLQLAGWLALLCASLPAYALQCDHGIVSIGDRAFTVQRKCGAPAYVDRYPEGFVPGVGDVGDIEQWYYNPGPQGLLRILLFRDGKLVRVDTDGSGFTDFIRGQCSPYELRPGMSEYELLARCGPPANRQSWYQGSPGFPATQRVEEWTYNFGSNQFIRHVRLVDGRIESAKLGERGY